LDSHLITARRGKLKISGCVSSFFTVGRKACARANLSYVILAANAGLNNFPDDHCARSSFRKVIRPISGACSGKIVAWGPSRSSSWAGGRWIDCIARLNASPPPAPPGHPPVPHAPRTVSGRTLKARRDATDIVHAMGGFSIFFSWVLTRCMVGIGMDLEAAGSLPEHR